MARLPTALDLSGPANLRSGRAIAQIDTSAIGRGAASLGSDLSTIAGQLRQQEKVIGATRATAALDIGLIGIDNQAEADGDYATLPTRVGKQTEDLVEKSSLLISDPRTREQWKEQARVSAARTADGVRDKSVGLAQEQGRVELAKALQTQANILGNPDLDINTRNKAKAEAAASIDYARDSGLLTPAQAQTWQDQYVKNPTVTRIGLEAGKRPEAFRDSVTATDIPPEGVALLDTIAGTESPGYNVLNGGERFSSYADHPRRIGKGGTATAAGRYQFVKGTWDRAQRATGVPDFSPASQDKAAWWLAQSDYKAHTGRDLLSDLKSPDANVQANIRRTLSSTWEGLKSLGDGQFASKVASGPVQRPDGWNELTPEQQYQAVKIANTEQNRRDTETRSNIQIVEQNAPVAIMNTGTYNGAIPDAQQYMAAYGSQEGATRYNNLMAQIDTAKTAHDMQTMPASQIMAAVEQARPTSSGDDAVVQQQRYTALSNAADAVLKARAADPVTYTRQAYPAVDEAWKAATDQPSMQVALTKTAEAQKALGIISPVLMPAQQIDRSIAAFKNEQMPEATRAEAIGMLFAATTDKAQQSAIFDQLVKAGLPPETEGAINALLRGDTGAASRLFQASMVDPAKLAGTLPNDLKPSHIDAAVQTSIMDEGQIGDLYYGLSDGTAENFTRAQRDSKLINNAVNLRLRNGETLDQAIAGVSKDLYGDVQPATGPNVQILVPADQDANAVVGSLQALLPDVRAAMTTALAVPADTKTSDGTKAILDAVTRDSIDRVMSEGYFRNSGDGYVYIDPYVGAAITDEQGNPVIFRPKTVVPGAASNTFPNRTPEPGAGPSLDENGNPVVLQP